MQTSNAQELFKNFESRKILIIGDVMIDSYLIGKVERISPEAPVPVVDVHKRELRLGGAANVARNLKAMGATPILCSVIGKDAKAEDFMALLDKNKMLKEGILQSDKRITTTKHRIMGNAIQMLRVDEEDSRLLHQNDAENFIELIQSILSQYQIDAIILQDYDKGVLSPTIIKTVIELAGDIPTTVDPKYNNFMAYQGCTLFKPNLKELCEGTQNAISELKNDFKKLKTTAENLMRKLNIHYLFTTLSEDGVLISEHCKDKVIQHYYIPAHLRSIADVSGAGDTVISITALCLSIGLSAYQTAYLSNLAGGLVCEIPGVVPINKISLAKELDNNWQEFSK